MTDVEIIYLKNKTNSAKTQKPKNDICKNQTPVRKVQNKSYKSKIYKKKKKNRRPSFYIGIFITLLLISTFLFASHNAGFVPIDAFLNIKSPSGSYNEIKYSEVVDYYPITESIPEINGIKHKLFETDEDLRVVAENYRYDLLDEGFELEYKGVREIKGINVHYYGYVKGITAVAIFVTSDSIDILNSETLVLYSTGDIFSYKNIINKYSNRIDL